MRFNTVLKTLVAVALCVSTFARANPLELDVTGIQSVDLFHSRDNTVLYFDVGANSTITTLSYNIEITAFDVSWLSEMAMAFTNSAGLGVSITPAPGAANRHAGTGHYAAFIDLDDINGRFNVGGDGILRVEFYEHFNDVTGSDGQWDSGTVTFGVQETADAPVPEPSTALLTGAGLALLGWLSRRRERTLSKKITEQN
jgi:hypothetical protein